MYACDHACVLYTFQDTHYMAQHHGSKRGISVWLGWLSANTGRLNVIHSVYIQVHNNYMQVFEIVVSIIITAV